MMWSSRRWIGFTSLVAIAAGASALRGASDTAIPSHPADDGVVLELRSTDISMHIHDKSPEFFQWACAAIDQIGIETDGEQRCYGPLEDNKGKFDPDTSVMNYRLSIKGDRVRMDFGGSAMLGSLGADGSIGEWRILDPTTGRVLDSDTFTRGLESSQRMPFATELTSVRQGAFTLDNRVQGPNRSGATARIAGHTARKYDYSYDSSILAHAGEGEHGGFGISVVGEAWYAEEGPYADDDSLRNIFRKLAPHMVFASLGSGSAGLSAFGAPGVLLRVKEELTVLIFEVSERGMVAEGRPIMSTSSLDEVTAIMRRPLADSLFGALEQPRQGCDCSCEAFDELKAIAKLPKAKQEAHPKAMALSMCAPECGMRWGTQCRRN